MSNVQELMMAVVADDGEAVGRLLAAEPGLAAARGEDGASAVLTAVYRRRPQALAALLATNPALDLFEAAALGRTDRLVELLTADPAAARAQAADGFTALHLAAFFHQPQTAELLLDRGADASSAATNATRVTPLNSAAAARSREVVALLLARGAQVDAAQHGGWTALHSAAHNGDLAVIDLLLAHGADRARKSDDGKTALDMAVEAGHAEAAERLRG